MAENFEHLSLEQLHHDLVELKDVLDRLPDTIAENMPEAVNRKHMEVTVKNPTAGLEITNEVKAHVSNLDGLAERLDAVISSVKNSRVESVDIKNVSELTSLLQKLIDKDQSVHVAAPIVKAPVINTPDTVKVSNLPTGPADPISVRLSDGKRFINELVRVVGGGGLPTALVDGNALRTSDKPYAQKITTVGSITYVAKAEPGTAQSSPAWQVQKVDETIGTVITWADGNALFDNVATDLTALSYT